MADLVTLAEYKIYTGINSTNQDVQLGNIIPKVSQLVKTYCNRTFIDFYSSPNVLVDNGGSSYILLPDGPIKEIVSVEESQDFGQTYTVVPEYIYYVVNKKDDRLETTLPSGEFTPGVNRWRITYKGGFAECPEDLKLAVLDLITYYIKNETSVKSTRTPGSNSASVEYITTSSLPSHIRRVLDLYREYLI